MRQNDGPSKGAMGGGMLSALAEDAEKQSCRDAIKGIRRVTSFGTYAC